MIRRVFSALPQCATWPGSIRVVQARIDAALVRFAATGQGDVKSLKGRPGELRLRVGKWRIFFFLESPDLIRVLGIDKPG